MNQTTKDSLSEKEQLLVKKVQQAYIPVEFIRGNCNNQVVTESLGSFEQIDMTIVHEIICAVCYNSLHREVSFRFVRCKYSIWEPVCDNAPWTGHG